MDVDLDLRKTRPERIEIFDFKFKDGHNLFKDSTSQTKEFSECFNGENSLLFQIEKWRKILITHCKKSFKKIRIIKNKKEASIAVLIDKRNKILHEDSEENLKEIDYKIAECEALENFKSFSENPESISMQKMWKIIKKISPTLSPTLPKAKRNHKGKILRS